MAPKTKSTPAKTAEPVVEKKEVKVQPPVEVKPVPVAAIVNVTELPSQIV